MIGFDNIMFLNTSSLVALLYISTFLIECLSEVSNTTSSLFDVPAIDKAFFRGWFPKDSNVRPGDFTLTYKGHPLIMQALSFKILSLHIPKHIDKVTIVFSD